MRTTHLNTNINFRLMFTLATLVLSSTSAFAEPSEVWTRQLGTADIDHGNAIAVDRCGNVYVGGTTRGAFPHQQYSGGYDAFLAKYDSNGNLQWVRQWGTANDEWTKELEVSPDGYLWAAEASGQGKEEHITLIKFDPSGNQCCRVQVNQGSVNCRFISDLHLDRFGFLYLTAHSGSPAASIVAKYDAFGRECWTRTIQLQDGRTILQGITTNLQGQIFAVGYESRPGSIYSHPALYEFDAWGQQRNYVLLTKLAYLTRVAVDSAGRPIAAGWTLLRTDDQSPETIHDPPEIFLDEKTGEITPESKAGWTVSPIFIGFRKDGSVDWHYEHLASALKHPYAFEIDHQNRGWMVGYASSPKSSRDGFSASVKFPDGITWHEEVAATINAADGTIDQNGGMYVVGSTEGDEGVNEQPSLGKTDLYLIKYRR